MKERNKLIIAIIIVIAIIAVVVGATYAYWQWQTSSEQQTDVSFTIMSSGSQLNATLIGGGTTAISNLAPAACTNATYAFKKEITLNYTNLTSQAAKVNATLTVSGFNQPHSGSLDLSKLHYVLNTSSANCTSATVLSGGTNSSFVKNGALINNLKIKDVPANTSSGSQKYYLWVWIDKNYTSMNTGNTISDPMQDLTFKLTWSGSITNQ